MGLRLSCIVSEISMKLWMRMNQVVLLLILFVVGGVLRGWCSIHTFTYTKPASLGLAC
jgi:hypothetical protein